MKYLIILLTFILFTGCENQEGSVIIDTALDISVKDDEGSDLLNSLNPNSLNANDIKVIYEINGEQIEFNEPHLDASRGFSVFQHENEYRIRIFPNTDKNISYPVTYIQWNSVDTDTLKCEIERKSNYEVCRKVWLNGEVVWDDFGIERFIEIIK